MRIWFDISNSPHVNMFYDLIKELESEGHEIIITSRPLANTVALLDQKGLKHTIIGQHYGKNIIKKILGYPIRVLQLYQFLKSKKVDIAVSQSSFHSPLVAKLLSVPSIYTNDNEYALGNKPSFFFATRILIPENMSLDSILGWGVPFKKIRRYPGIKEGIYLWKKKEKVYELRDKNLTSKVHIFIRPEPQTAQYYSGKEYFLDDLIIALQKKYSITVLIRNADQYAHYTQANFANINVPAKPMSFEEVASKCGLFIGAGGSMTREIALLGIPTISVYQDELLEVDQLLIFKGLMWHEMTLTPEKVEYYLQQLPNKMPELDLMEKGQKAYQMFREEILSFIKK